MVEREPIKETIDKGDLFYLYHPGTEEVFSGYGLTVEAGRNDQLAGLLMVDRPEPADPEWLRRVEEAFDGYELVAMTPAGERGIACRMEIGEESVHHLRRFPSNKSKAIQGALEPLLEEPPAPVFRLSWDGQSGLWRSEFALDNELPAAIREVFERTGYGCLAAETDSGIIHVCHAPDTDIEGFAGKPVLSQWQLIEMPSASLIRLELIIIDDPVNPFKFESFLNVAEEDQAEVLAQLANQEQLHLAFYGDDLNYRFTKSIPHDEQQWQQLDELVERALSHWETIPPERRDYDGAKADFMRRFI
jgi:hypothetical protein